MDALCYCESIMTIGEHLKRRREEQGLTQLALAARSGVPQTYIRQIEKGYRQPGEGLARLLLIKGLRQSEEEAQQWLREWRLTSRATLPAGWERFAQFGGVVIPIFRNAPVRPAAESPPDAVDYLSLPRHAGINPHHRLFSLMVDGLTLKEESILPGDFIVIDQDAPVQHGDVALVRIKDTVLLKRIFFDDDLVELHPTDGQVKAMPTKDVEFIGKVIAHVRRL